MKRFIAAFAALAMFSVMGFNAYSADGSVKIRSDFPGGNVTVVKNEPGKAEIEPDLRGGNPWFYWNFETETDQPGSVEFILPDNFKMGAKGPAVSFDGGRTWTWMGTDNVFFGTPRADGKKRDSFKYDFKNKAEKIRFAVAIPYLQSEFDDFLKRNAGNSHLSPSVLTKSSKGLPVELLQIGKPGDGVKPFLVTARHHACESMASYVLEGFLQEAMSDSYFGNEFRKKYVLYAVPFVDKDGVQSGDQGKGRKPHDHNRDYGTNPSYPEVKAIQELADAKKVEYALDFHCPAIRGDVHEMFYFDGRKVPHIYENAKALAQWLNAERPPVIMSYEGVFLKPKKGDDQPDGLPFSIYFASRKGMVFAATLEVPYAQSSSPLDAAIAREYGKSLLRAWMRMDFVTESPADAKPKAYSEFEAFGKSFKGSPADIEKIAMACINDKNSQGINRAESFLRLSALYLRQKKYQEALDACKSILDEPSASLMQKSSALTQRVLIVCSDPSSTPEKVASELAALEAFGIAAPRQKYEAYGAVSSFFISVKDNDKALLYAEKQLANANVYDKGKVLNSIAAIYDAMNKKDKAVETRKQAVAHLRSQLFPTVPVGVFGPMMASDLFDALNGIPESTFAEKKEAADIALNHKVCTPWLKDKLTKALNELEKK